ncbi:MAG: hypothetical protein KF890_04335 [Nitrospira sp.]|nr:hypothetical protein [Nitrospira sp.]
MWNPLLPLCDHWGMRSICRLVPEPSRLVCIVVLGVSVFIMSLTPRAAAEATDQPMDSGSARDTAPLEVPGERPSPSGLDNTPGGGTVPGGSVPGGTVPGGTVPGGSVPGGTLPGGTVPGGTVPGGTLPGGTVPGGTVPSEKLPGEDG